MNRRITGILAVLLFISIPLVVLGAQAFDPQPNTYILKVYDDGSATVKPCNCTQRCPVLPFETLEDAFDYIRESQAEGK